MTSEDEGGAQGCSAGTAPPSPPSPSWASTHVFSSDTSVNEEPSWTATRVLNVHVLTDYRLSGGQGPARPQRGSPAICMLLEALWGGRAPDQQDGAKRNQLGRD